MVAKLNGNWLAAALLLALGSHVTPAYGVTKAKLELEDARPATPALVDGNPALQWSANGWATYISVGEYKGATAFKFPVSHQKPRGDGFLYITATLVAWVPTPGSGGDDQPFEVSSRDVTTDASGWGCTFRVKGKWGVFLPLYQRSLEQPDSDKGSKISGESKQIARGAFSTWSTDAVSDFQAAESRFHSQVGEAIWVSSASVIAELQAFQQKVAVWRAAGSKVDPPGRGAAPFRDCGRSLPGEEP